MQLDPISVMTLGCPQTGRAPCSPGLVLEEPTHQGSTWEGPWPAAPAPPRSFRGAEPSKAQDQGSSHSPPGRQCLPPSLPASWGQILPWRPKTLVGVDAAPGRVQLPALDLEQSRGTHRGQLPHQFCIFLKMYFKPLNCISEITLQAKWQEEKP